MQVRVGRLVNIEKVTTDETYIKNIVIPTAPELMHVGRDWSKERFRFFTLNAKRISRIPLSRDVHIWVTHTNAR